MLGAREDGFEDDAAREGQGEFVVAGAKSAPLFDGAEPALDDVALAVVVPVERRWPAAA
jgi:hypothetical protein